MYSDCVLFLFINCASILICIVPLMSVKFPVKLTEDKSFYLSTEIFVMEKKKKQSKNNPE